MSRLLERLGLVAALGLTFVGVGIGLGMATMPHPAAAETFGPAFGTATNCSSPSACVSSKNSGTGPAIGGTALKNIGTEGTTLSNLNSHKKVQGYTFGTTAGIAGYDDATVVPDLNQGVLGISNMGTGVTGISESTDPNGGSGVVGLDLSANNPMSVGVYGYSGADAGVFGDGHTATGIGVFGHAADGGDGVFGLGQTANAIGVFGDATDASGVGVFGVASATSGEGVSGSAPNGGFGVVGNSTGGIGVSGISDVAAGVGGLSTSGFGVVGQSHSSGGVLAESGSSSIEALRITANGGGALIRASNASKEVMSLDNAGNLIVVGSVTQFGTPNLVTRNGLGGRTVMYSAKQSVATVEDVGEGQLAGGQALVRIDPAFAATMDPTRPYLVFITPQGDSNGLYVTGKTPGGFIVREHNGRSNIAFDYRIVAKPFGSTDARLPAWTAPIRSAPAPFALSVSSSADAHALQRLRTIRIPRLQPQR
jgi:hypothetical protein